MGSPDFAVPILRVLAQDLADVALVVTQPDRPAGRGGILREPPVKRLANALGIAVLQPEKLRDTGVFESLHEVGADTAVVAAYGKILPQRFLDLPRRGCLNVHASLLPRWRGASPVAAAILAGDGETGVSLMEMVKEMDAGPVVARQALPILADDTTDSLEPRLAELAAQVLRESFAGWLEGSIRATPQDETGVTYCRTLRKDDGVLQSTMTAGEAERAVRAYNPWPGASVGLAGQRLAIWRAHVRPDDSARPGTLAATDREPRIGFSGGWLVLDEVQKPGGKRISGAAFLNGERGKLPPEVALRD